MNKTRLIVLAVVSLMILPLSAQSTTQWRGGGHHGGGHGNGNGTGGGGIGNGTGVHKITEGTPFSIDGTILSTSMYGNELVVSLTAGNMTVTGLGPTWFWSNLDMTKPVVGDKVNGNGYTVNFNGVIRNVLTDITVNGTLVQLRDENGYPLWRGQGGGHWGKPGRGGFKGICFNILEGTPFNYVGEVISAAATNFGIHGNGVELATGSGNVTVTGIGPNYYWQNLGVIKPVVGDSITVNGYTIDAKWKCR